jgi:hypothetical protein
MINQYNKPECGRSMFGPANNRRRYRCNERDCWRCQDHKAESNGDRIERNTADYSHPVTILLTWQGDLPIEDVPGAAKAMMRAYRAASRRVAFRAVKQKGFEIPRSIDASWSAGTDTYSPHLHLYATSDGTDPEIIKAAVQKVWPYHVDVRVPEDANHERNAARYVAKSLFTSFQKGNPDASRARIRGAVSAFKAATHGMHGVRCGGRKAVAGASETVFIINKDKTILRRLGDPLPSTAQLQAYVSLGMGMNGLPNRLGECRDYECTRELRIGDDGPGYGCPDDYGCPDASDSSDRYTCSP